MVVPLREEVKAENTKRLVQVVQALHAVFVLVPLGTASLVSNQQYKTGNPSILLLLQRESGFCRSLRKGRT